MSWETNRRDNQTPEHERLVDAAATWIAHKVTLRGMRAAMELAVPSAYSPDLLVMGDLSGFASHDRYGWKHYDTRIFVFEAKQSRPDFMRTFGKDYQEGVGRAKPLGHLHWVVAPKGLIQQEELPVMWGLLEKSSRGLRMIRDCQPQAVEDARVHEIGHALLWAREGWIDNHRCTKLADEIAKSMRRRAKGGQP